MLGAIRSNQTAVQTATVQTAADVAKDQPLVDQKVTSVANENLPKSNEPVKKSLLRLFFEFLKNLFCCGFCRKKAQTAQKTSEKAQEVLVPKTNAQENTDAVTGSALNPAAPEKTETQPENNSSENVPPPPPLPNETNPVNNEQPKTPEPTVKTEEQKPAEQPTVVNQQPETPKEQTLDPKPQENIEAKQGEEQKPANSDQGEGTPQVVVQPTQDSEEQKPVVKNPPNKPVPPVPSNVVKTNDVPSKQTSTSSVPVKQTASAKVTNPPTKIVRSASGTAVKDKASIFENSPAPTKSTGMPKGTPGKLVVPTNVALAFGTPPAVKRTDSPSMPLNQPQSQTSNEDDKPLPASEPRPLPKPLNKDLDTKAVADLFKSKGGDGSKNFKIEKKSEGQKITPVNLDKKKKPKWEVKLGVTPEEEERIKKATVGNKST